MSFARITCGQGRSIRGRSSPQNKPAAPKWINFMSKVRWLADYWQSGSLLAEVCHLCEGVRSSIGHLVISCCMCLSEYCECVSLGSDSIDCVGHNLLRRVPMYTSLGGKPAPRVRFDYTEKGDSTPRTGTVKFRSINSAQIPAEFFLIDSRKFCNRQPAGC